MTSHRTWAVVVLLPLACVAAKIRTTPSASRSLSSGAKTVSNSEIATDVGLDVLRAGGNAVDAAVAMAFALAVVYPQAGNLGGGGFAVLRTATGETAALDFRETAPAASTRGMFLTRDGTPSDRSLRGHVAAGVPGTVAGLWELHRRYGKRAWREVIRPAEQLARNGFVVERAFAGAIGEEVELLMQDPASETLFLPGGKPLFEGRPWHNGALARTLGRIAARGPKDFYQGETAETIVSEMQRGRGLITHADLRSYRAKWRTPVSFSYRGATVVSMPPPSSGGIALALIAGILEGFDLGTLGRGSVDATHVTVEAFRRAFALRNSLLGDPDFVPIPSARFLAATSVADLRKSIRIDRATPSADVAVTQTSLREGAETTHLSVVDSAGNAVALTTTLNTNFGSGVTVKGAGFLLNNEMDDFTVAPGMPNTFGLIQGDANAIAPGKRMLSSMSPTLVVGADGKTLLVTGAAGGPTIITTVFQILSNVLDYGMNVEAAACAARIHHQHLPDVIRFEDGALSQEVVTQLEARGHRFLKAKRIGNANTIMRKGQTVVGAAESRL